MNLSDDDDSYDDSYGGSYSGSYGGSYDPVIDRGMQSIRSTPTR
jgi:hypothetical protein